MHLFKRAIIVTSAYTNFHAYVVGFPIDVLRFCDISVGSGNHLYNVKLVFDRAQFCPDVYWRLLVLY